MKYINHYYKGMKKVYDLELITKIEFLEFLQQEITTEIEKEKSKKGGNKECIIY